MSKNLDNEVSENLTEYQALREQRVLELADEVGLNLGKISEVYKEKYYPDRITSGTIKRILARHELKTAETQGGIRNLIGRQRCLRKPIGKEEGKRRSYLEPNGKIHL